MLVVYHQPNLYTLGAPVKQGVKPTVLLKLLPGPNKVDPKVFEEAKKNKIFQAHIDDGIIEVLDEGVDDIESLAAPKAKKVIAELCDVGELEKLKESKKKFIVTAATKRLEEIESMRDETKGKKDDDDEEIFR